MSEALAGTALASRPAAIRFGDGVAVLACVLLIPALLYAAHAAPLLRYAYPAMNLALAGYLYSRRSPWFAGHVLLLFCFVSLVRRLVDDQAGFDPASPVLITPYLCALFTAHALVEYWFKPRPQFLGAILVILFAITYGALLAVLQGNIVAAAIDALKWAAGPLFAVYVLSQRKTRAEVREVVESCLVWAGAFMGLYGVFQYVAPASWDLVWIRGVIDLGMTSIGQPEPYAMRVFGTMNSPGSMGAFLAAGMLVAFKRPLPVAVPAITLMLLGLALAQYRTIWAATALGVVMLMFTRPGAFRPSNVVAAVAVLLGISGGLLVPQIRETVVDRASSLTNLRADYSGEERLGQYQVLARDPAIFVGEGLGQAGVARRLGGMSNVILDSGLIEIWRGLGLIAGTFFLGALALLVVSLFQRAPDIAHHLDYDRAIVATAFLQLPMGSVHTGEASVVAWLFLGLGLAALGGRLTGRRLA
jgi:hypothetical protein